MKKYDEMTMFRTSVAVAVCCTEENRPARKDLTPESAADYIRDVLEIVFPLSGLEITVQPLMYPICSKIPLRIALAGVGECLFWYYSDVDRVVLAAQLADTLSDIVPDVIQCVPA